MKHPDERNVGLTTSSSPLGPPGPLDPFGSLWVLLVHWVHWILSGPFGPLGPFDQLGPLGPLTNGFVRSFRSFMTFRSDRSQTLSPRTYKSTNQKVKRSKGHEANRPRPRPTDLQFPGFQRPADVSQPDSPAPGRLPGDSPARGSERTRQVSSPFRGSDLEGLVGLGKTPKRRGAPEGADRSALRLIFGGRQDLPALVNMAAGADHVWLHGLVTVGAGGDHGGLVKVMCAALPAFHL
jgi:hypothetical protein